MLPYIVLPIKFQEVQENHSSHLTTDKPLVCQSK